MRLPVAVAVSAVLALAAPGAAQGSCAARSAKQYFQDADLVFLARAGKPRTEGQRVVQPFEVLLALKGKPGATFKWVHGIEPPPGGGSQYKPGEIAILLPHGGHLDPCSGNVPLGAQLAALPTYLELAKKKAQPAPEEAFQVGLQAALKGYLHKRPRVPVVHEPLAGRKLRVEESELPFVSRAQKGAVIITRALQADRLVLISGRYPVEGYVFSVLLLRSGEKLEALAVSAAET